MRRPTITDIAAHAGVSRTTVSLVLRDADKIPATTKAHVRASIAALGYVYNRAGAAVRVGHSGLLGLLLTDIRNPFFADITTALDQRVTSLRLSVLLSFSFGDPAREVAAARSLAEHQVGGLILLPTPGSRADELAFLPPAQPLVQLLREVPDLASDFVGVDNTESGRILGRHLATSGFTDVVFVGSAPSPQLAARHDGLQRGLGRPIDLVLGGAAGLAPRLASTRPDCVVTYNDAHLLEVLSTLRAHDRRPGGDIGVASFDNTTISSLTWPAVTSVDHHASELAAAALGLVEARMDDPERPFERRLISPSLVVRASTTEPR